MDETLKSFSLLVLGALLSFIPQEISKHYQAKRDEEKEARAIKQQRRQIDWQKETDKLEQVMLIIGEYQRSVVITRSDDVDPDKAFFMTMAILRYPILKEPLRVMTWRIAMYSALSHSGKDEKTDSQHKAAKDQADKDMDKAIEEFFRLYREQVSLLA